MPWDAALVEGGAFDCPTLGQHAGAVASDVIGPIRRVVDVQAPFGIPHAPRRSLEEFDEGSAPRGERPPSGVIDNAVGTVEHEGAPRRYRSPSTFEQGAKRTHRLFEIALAIPT